MDFWVRASDSIVDLLNSLFLYHHTTSILSRFVFCYPYNILSFLYSTVLPKLPKINSDFVIIAQDVASLDNAI
jgi:hypothetical protein